MTVTVRAVGELPELVAGVDLVDLLLAGGPGLVDGDVLTVSSKAVAKVEGLVTAGTREDLIDAETDREVARRGRLRIVRTRLGLVLAAAGVDASNTAEGTVVPLPRDPDASARGLRERIADRAGVNVAVVLTDTAGRAWRLGQTDIAVGCAGLEPLHDLSGHPDAGGRPLEVTAPATADELAGAADLVLAKAAGTPVAVISGLAGQVLPTGQHGPGAVALVRPEGDDLFGLGAREAVRAAVRRSDGDARGFAGADTHPNAVLAELAPLACRDADEVSLDVSGPLAVVRPAPGRAPADRDVLLAAGAVAERLRVLVWARGVHLVAQAAPAGAVSAWAVRERP